MGSVFVGSTEKISAFLIHCGDQCLLDPLRGSVLVGSIEGISAC